MGVEPGALALNSGFGARGSRFSFRFGKHFRKKRSAASWRGGGPELDHAVHLHFQSLEGRGNSFKQLRGYKMLPTSFWVGYVHGEITNAIGFCSSKARADS